MRKKSGEASTSSAANLHAYVPKQGHKVPSFEPKRSTYSHYASASGVMSSAFVTFAFFFANLAITT
jgi:hypothetical protein